MCGDSTGSGGDSDGITSDGWNGTGEQEEQFTSEIEDKLEKTWDEVAGWDTAGEAPELTPKQDTKFEEKMVEWFENKGFDAVWESGGKNCFINIYKNGVKIAEADYVDFDIDFDV